MAKSKAEQRRQRLVKAEAELANEEAEAFKMTDEQQRLLSKCFATVKAEFSDLDGLRWTQSALQNFQAEPPSQPHTPLRSHEFDSFSSEDTIRISSPLEHSFSPCKSVSRYMNIQCRHRDGTRLRPRITSIFGCNSDGTLLSR